MPIPAQRSIYLIRCRDCGVTWDTTVPTAQYCNKCRVLRYKRKRLVNEAKRRKERT